MAKISTWSTTAGDNNSASPDGFPENMAPSGVNNAAREVMAQVRAWYEDAQWIDLGDTVTYATASTFTIATDVTATYHVGRRVKCTDSSTLYGTITASSYSAPNTTVTVNLDSGSLSASLTAVSVSALTESNHAIPRQVLLESDIGTGLTVTSNIVNLDANDLTAETTVNAGADYFVMYDSSASATRKVLIENIPSTPGTIIDPAVAGGTGDAITATTSETAYTTNHVYAIKLTATNTGAATINLDSIGAKNIKLLNGDDPYAGELLSGMVAFFLYDGTNMVLLNPHSLSGALVYEHEVTGSAVTEIDITGLDSSKDKRYRVEIEWYNGSASTSNLALYCNGDYTDANYTSDTSGTTAANTANIVISSAAGEYSCADALVTVTGGYYMAVSNYCRFAPGSSGVTLTSAVCSDATLGAAITSLRVSASVASAIGVGSKVRVYRG